MNALDPEETEREALAKVSWTETHREAWHHLSANAVDAILAAGFRRLSESAPVTFEQVEAVASTIDAVLGPVRITNTETIRVARAVIERLRLSESEMRREWGVSFGGNEAFPIPDHLLTNYRALSARDPEYSVVSRTVGEWIKESDQ